MHRAGSEDEQKIIQNQGKKLKLNSSVPSGVANFSCRKILVRTGECPLGS
jgi:hypothetical protein